MEEWSPRTPRSRKEWNSKVPDSPNSVVREHSAYCEATGPIVQEGFVASRIRVFQHLQIEGDSVIQSHSPMTPCPRPWIWPHEVDYHSKHPSTPTPAPIAMRRSDWALMKSREKPVSSNRHQNSSSEAPPQNSTTQSKLHVVKSSTPRTPLLQPAHRENPTVNDTIASKVQRSSDHTHEILSPRAVPAEQTEPSKVLSLISQLESRDHENGHEQSIPMKRSIADRLGSMVERDWVETDVFGKSKSDRKISDPILSHTHIGGEQKKYRKHSEMDEPLKEPLPEPGFASRPRSKDQSYRSQTLQSQVLEVHQKGEEEVKPVKEHSPRKNEQRQARGIAITSHVLQRSSSDAEVLNSRGFIPSSAGNQEEQSRRSLRLKRSQSHETKLSTTPSFHARDRVNSDDDHEAAGLANPITAPFTPNSRRSSINTQKSTRSVSGKTRWKLRWPKLVPMDSQTPVRGYLKVEPVGSASPKSRKHTQQDPARLKALPQDGNYEHARSLDDGLSEMKAFFDERKEYDASYSVSQYQSSMGQTYGVLDLQASQQSRNVRDTSSSALLERFPNSSPRWVQSVEESSPGTARHSPARSPSRNRTSSKRWPKRASVSTSTYGTFITTPGGISEDSSRQTSSEITQNYRTSSVPPAAVVSHSLEATQGSSTRSLSPIHNFLKNSRTEEWPGLISSGSATVKAEARSNAASPEVLYSDETGGSVKRSRTSTGASNAIVQVSGLREVVKRETRSSGKAIKRVQVTVTFDGAADLVIDARLDPTRDGENEDVASTN